MHFPDFDYFMSIDADLVIRNNNTGDNIIDKLIDHNLEFVGGLYSLKSVTERKCSSIAMEGAILPKFNSGLLEMRWMSTGCWCIHRSVVTKMIKAYPELIYDGDDNAANEKIYGFYIPYIYEFIKEDFPDEELSLGFKKYISEDWAFCQRWRQIGGKMYADTSILLDHIGKHPFTLYSQEDVEFVKQQQQPQPPQAGHDLKKEE